LGLVSAWALGADVLCLALIPHVLVGPVWFDYRSGPSERALRIVPLTSTISCPLLSPSNESLRPWRPRMIPVKSPYRVAAGKSHHEGPDYPTLRDSPPFPYLAYILTPPAASAPASRSRRPAPAGQPACRNRPANSTRF